MLLVKEFCFVIVSYQVNTLKPELNPSAQRYVTRFFAGEFASWTVNFVFICVKNQKNTPVINSSLLIMYGSSYMFRHSIATIRERS
jgi:hypothetical protein